MKKLYAFIFIVCIFIFSITVEAQISEGGVPRSFNANKLSEIYHEVIVSPPDMGNVINEDLENDQQGKPRRFAKLLPVDINPDNAGTWEFLEDGSRIWRLRLHSVNAMALCPYFNDFFLPEGAKLFLYDDFKQKVIGAFTEKNNQSSRLFTTSLILGDAFTIELFIPGEQKNSTQNENDETLFLHLSDIGYAYRDVPNYDSSKGINSDWCEVNVNCSPEGDNWQNQKNGVVRIRIKVSGGNYWCTGSLVNNARFDLTPYVLTADHCAHQLGHYATADDLSQWVFTFNYESPNCQNLTPEVKTLTGAVKIAQGGYKGQTGSDFYFLLLNDNVPVDYNVFYSGWSAQDLSSETGVTIHHPGGDIKKISTYIEPLLSTGWQNNNLQSHWEVVWSETINGWGVTEGGSSGSPIYNSEGLLIGTLTGGYAACDNFGIYGPEEPDYYGKFSYHWESNGTVDTAQLKPWLDPENTGINFLSGTILSTPSIKTTKKNDVFIYPNPAEDFVYLKFINFEPLKFKIDLVDLLGKPVKNFSFNNAGNNSVIDISGFKPGIYFIKISYDQQEIVKRIVKR